jgi:cation diffusion facilitator CzcD-associated flavoprotein CzcO
MNMVEQTSALGTAREVDVVVVGAGLAGLYLTHRLRKAGKKVQTFESGGGVGGTWYWNRYPGSRVDAESLVYSYGFDDDLQQEWHWTEKFATRDELRAYLEHVADRYDLWPLIQLNTTVTSAAFDEATNLWTVSTDQGDSVTARYVVGAVGCLTANNVPNFPGLQSFKGQWYHTSRWPEEGVDLRGKRVGVIGTGSTGVQVIAALAPEVEHLHAFQRTPVFCVPSNNAPMDPAEEAEWKSRYRELREESKYTPTGSPMRDFSDKAAFEVSEEERQAEFEKRWAQGHFNLMRSFKDLMTSEEANGALAEFVRGKIRAVVKDPKTAELLSPRGFPIGTKRVSMDPGGYYEAYNRDNVTLVDVHSAPIERITETGIATADAEYELDVIVFATGFDAMTGGLTRLGIVGRGGIDLAKKWENGPHTYLGLSTAGFPNFFFVTGPGSPSVLSNMITSIEQHVEWISDLVVYADDHGAATVEATPEAEEQWFEHCQEVGSKTLYLKANSWYVGANIPGKPRMLLPYVGGVGPYRRICDEVQAQGYRGFALTASGSELAHA